VLTRVADGVELGVTYELVSAEYKILFTFDDGEVLSMGDYLLEIYGVMTPVSLQNGAFSIIYQR
jgi:hypothetical protein